MPSPSESPTSDSPTQEIVESHHDFDILREIESLTGSVALIDDGDLSSISRPWSPPSLSDVSFSYLYRHFCAILQDQANSWSLVARESTLLLSRHLINDPEALRSVLPSLSFPTRTVLYFIDVAIRKERPFHNTPVSISRTAFEAASAGIREMIASALRGVAYSYLTRVWQSVVCILRSPAIAAMRDPFFSLLPRLPEEVISGDRSQLFRAFTTWDDRFGYQFWHIRQTNECISWFANTATRYLLDQTLADMCSGVYVNIPEVYLNQTGVSEVRLVNPDELHLSEKAAFVLAWIVVEMRALALSPYYVFGNSPVLTPERVECVMQEVTLINGFFKDIMNPSEEDDSEILAERREALRQLFATLKCY